MKLETYMHLIRFLEIPVYTVSTDGKPYAKTCVLMGRKHMSMDTPNRLVGYNN
jgi:hypothetical protein